jgi:CheY-like chemotaxis protein
MLRSAILDQASAVRALEVIERHKGARRRGSRLALTANARAEDRSHALEAGFHMHLAKPIDPGEFTRTVAHAIAMRGS